MSQRNNSGRQAELDEHKDRAAGRRKTAELRETRGDDPQGKEPIRGAFGKGGVANRRTTLEGTAADSKSNAMNVGRSSRPGRKRS
jgi:hypothetical protein